LEIKRLTPSPKKKPGPIIKIPGAGGATLPPLVLEEGPREQEKREIHTRKLEGGCWGKKGHMPHGVKMAHNTRARAGGKLRGGVRRSGEGRSAKNVKKNIR